MGFLIAIPPTLLAFSLRAGWDPVRVVDGGLADSLHGMVMHESWAVAALKAVAIAFHPWVFRGGCTGTGTCVAVTSSPVVGSDHDDGRQCARVRRAAAGRSERSPFVEMTQGRVIDVKFAEPLAYELDGGARGTGKRLKAAVVPAALTFCVPEE